MNGYIEHLISSSEEMERELSRDFDACNFSDKPVILCFGVGENTFSVISKLEDLGIENTVFVQMSGFEDSITDHQEILVMDDYGMYDLEVDGEIKLPFIAVFLIDFTEDIDMKKSMHFIEETHDMFPYTNIVVMSVMPSGANRSKAIAKSKKLYPVCDTMFTVEESRIASMFPECSGGKLHIKTLSFLAGQFKYFAEMILKTGQINIDWYDIFGFITKAENECNKALFFTSSGNEPEEVVGSLLKDISHYEIEPDNVLIDVILSDESLYEDVLDCLERIDSFDFIWGFRISGSMKKNAVRINVFIKMK